jgi:SAM-dependent methyltransferase
MALDLPSSALSRADRDYAAKEASYFAGARYDFVYELPFDRAARVLEIGCGSGETGEIALDEGRAAFYAGVDVSIAAAERARGRLSQVITGDIEHLELPWAPLSFDALILSEVLEHLIDPGRVLSLCAPLLRPGAIVLASSPNVSHYSVVLELLRGRFELADSGTFDRTHMRWFTPMSYQALFEQAGFVVETLKPVTPFARRTALLSSLTAGRLDHLFMRQIWLKARKPG